MQNKHVFAFHIFQQIDPSLEKGGVFFVRDQDLCRRLVGVLRMRIGGELIVFNAFLAFECTLSSINEKKSELGFCIVRKIVIEPQNPTIVLCVGLLKKDAFEAVIESAAQFGVNAIQPILSAQVHRNWFSVESQTRLEKIMLGACELSKNFCVPKLYEPKQLESCISEIKAESSRNARVVLCDPSGTSPQKALDIIQENREGIIYLFVGPEGGFTSAEVEQLRSANAISIRLTKTILRAKEACCAGLSLLRCMLIK